MTKGKKILLCSLISLCIVSLQFTLDRKRHLKFENEGEITHAESKFSKGWTGEYAHISFTASNGKKIESVKKCGSKETFDREYANMLVMYNPEKPEDFINLYEFANYSLGYRIFFFFGIYFILLSFILFQLVRISTLANQFFRGNLNR